MKRIVFTLVAAGLLAAAITGCKASGSVDTTQQSMIGLIK